MKPEYDLNVNRRISIAPMMEYTHRHFRYFMRLITQHTLLYTEMVVTGAILHGDSARFLDHDAHEYPIALQLGGCDPKALQACAKIAAAYGYQEINLNVGCPSPRVQAGRIGACLMREPELVADCVKAMRDVVDIPVTVKTRIGVDHDDSPEFLQRFIETVSHAGCDTFIMHARKAWLKGLNPKQNRDIPMLNYECVYQLRTMYPHLTWIINGGIRTLDEVEHHLTQCDGVMIGRAATDTPMMFASVDNRFFNAQTQDAQSQMVLQQYLTYVRKQAQAGHPLRVLLQPLFGLMKGKSGAKAWRQSLNALILNKKYPHAEELFEFDGNSLIFP